MTPTVKTWLPSASWVAAAAATPWASREVWADDITAVSLLASFVLLGVLGFPLGVGLGRLGAVREAVAAAVLATAACAVLSFAADTRWTAGDAAVTVLLAVLFVILALPLPAIGFVIGWALRKRRR
jgi:hypothetical protein